MTIDPVDIVLINPDQGMKKHSYPWGILSLASYLNNAAGYTASILDGNVSARQEFFDKVNFYYRSGVRLFGIYCMSTDVYFVKNLADYIKGIDSGCSIIVGGPHAMLQPKQTCAYKNIDFVSYAHGERTVAELIGKMKDGDSDYRGVSGLLFKEDGEVKMTAASGEVPFYDMDYELLPEVTRRTYPEYIQVLTGRGCSFNCTFCFNSIMRQKWSGRGMADIVSELVRIVGKYKTKVFYFRDENFFHSRERVEEFIRLYKENNFSFQWRTSLRASYYNKRYIDFGLLKQLEEINCQTLKFGLESGSQRVLNYLKKGYKVENAKKLIFDLAQLKRIQSNYSFMIGLPGERPSEYMETFALIKYILKCDKNACVLGPQYYRVYPGGELYDEIMSGYEFSEPDSFEGWAQKYDPTFDPYHSYKQVDYPWVSKKYKFLVRYADKLIFLYRQKIKDYVNLKYFPMLIFVLMAKTRVRFNYYRCLYDLRAFVFFTRLRKKSSFLTNFFDIKFVRIR